MKKNNAEKVQKKTKEKKRNKERKTKKEKRALLKKTVSQKKCPSVIQRVSGSVELIIALRTLTSHLNV